MRFSPRSRRRLAEVETDVIDNIKYAFTGFERGDLTEEKAQEVNSSAVSYYFREADDLQRIP